MWNKEIKDRQDILIVRILQEIRPKIIWITDKMEKGIKKDKETRQVHESKGRNTVLRNVLCTAKKSSKLLGEERGYGRVQQRSD